jgi:hypothetical protein
MAIWRLIEKRGAVEIKLPLARFGQLFGSTKTAFPRGENRDSLEPHDSRTKREVRASTTT